MNWAALFTFDCWRFMTAISPLMLLEMGFPVWGASTRNNGWGFINRSYSLPSKTAVLFIQWGHMCVLPSAPSSPHTFFPSEQGWEGSRRFPHDYGLWNVSSLPCSLFKTKPGSWIPPEKRTHTVMALLLCSAQPQEELQDLLCSQHWRHRNPTVYPSNQCLPLTPSVERILPAVLHSQLHCRHCERNPSAFIHS